ncbi:MAG: hypothetical protein ACREQA_09120 [Candidatus Binatia bacterium]
MGVKAEEILENIVQLAELLDDEALEQIADLPFLELAKSVSINRRRAKPPRQVRKRDKARKIVRV